MRVDPPTTSTPCTARKRERKLVEKRDLLRRRVLALTPERIAGT
jgi:hypothetical protein